MLLLLAACGGDVSLVGKVGPLVASPSFTDLGAVPVGQEASVTIELVSGRGTVNVLAVEVLNVQGSWFTATGGEGAAVSPEAPGSLVVTYTPGAAGYHFAEVTLITDESSDNEHVVQVRGAAGEVAARVFPSLADLGPVESGGSASTSFTLANEGDVDLELAAVGLDDATFHVQTPLPLSLAAGSRSELEIVFDSDGGEHSSPVRFDLGALYALAPVQVQANWCSAPDGAAYDRDADGISVCAGDCDDGDSSAYPMAVEACDGTDDDCDGAIDEGTTCADDDGDGYSEDAGDCNDANVDMSPGLVEDYTNGRDDDCDGVTDDGNGDIDNDGFTSWAGDCDEADETAYPGGTEVPDGADNDCDGTVDEGTTAYDDDGDGYAEDGGDCDDTSASHSPVATEVADGRDNNCDSRVDEGTDRYDDDGDGFTESGGDCDDGNAAVSPAETETDGNGRDDDCDGTSS